MLSGEENIKRIGKWMGYEFVKKDDDGNWFKCKGETFVFDPLIRSSDATHVYDKLRTVKKIYVGIATERFEPRIRVHICEFRDDGELIVIGRGFGDSWMEAFYKGFISWMNREFERPVEQERKNIERERKKNVK